MVTDWLGFLAELENEGLGAADGADKGEPTIGLGEFVDCLCSHPSTIRVTFPKLIGNSSNLVFNTSGKYDFLLTSSLSQTECISNCKMKR